MTSDYLLAGLILGVVSVTALVGTIFQLRAARRKTGWLWRLYGHTPNLPEQEEDLQELLQYANEQKRKGPVR